MTHLAHRLVSLLVLAALAVTPVAAEEKDGKLVDDIAAEHALLWQQAQQSFKDLETQARQAILNADFNTAQKLAQEAQYVIDRNRRYSPSPEEYTAWRDNAEALGAFVAEEQRIASEQRTAEVQRDLVRREQARITKVDVARQRKISLLKNQADELSKERKYAEAIQILKQVLVLDATDSEAEWTLATLEGFASAARDRGLQQHKDAERQDLLIRNDESASPWHQDLLYPTTWREISAKRRGASEEGEDERTLRVRRKLQETVPEVSFSEVTFEEVIEFVRDVTGLNIIANWPALEALAIDPDIEVSLEMKEISVEKLLSQVLDQVGAGEVELGYEIDEGVVTISSREDLSRKTRLFTYNVEDLLISVPDFLGRSINLENIGQGGGQGGLGQGGGGGGGGLFGGGGGGAGGGGAGGGGNEGGEFTENVDVDALIELIQSTIDPESWREAGGNIGSVRPLRNQLIVTQTATAHQELRDLLQASDAAECE
ncbi:MAG: hypothetical protein V3T70_00820 [Phycisphaerae bacterium]